MYYSLTGFCNYLNETMTYTLTMSDYSSIPSWMTWDGVALVVKGTVPPFSDDTLNMRLTATDQYGN